MSLHAKRIQKAAREFQVSGIRIVHPALALAIFGAHFVSLDEQDLPQRLDLYSNHKITITVLQSTCT